MLLGSGSFSGAPGGLPGQNLQNMIAEDARSVPGPEN
jgi:hypothetical protein